MGHGCKHSWVTGASTGGSYGGKYRWVMEASTGGSWGQVQVGHRGKYRWVIGASTGETWGRYRWVMGESIGGSCIRAKKGLNVIFCINLSWGTLIMLSEYHKNLISATKT